jgi:hypothetical protein
MSTSGFRPENALEEAMLYAFSSHDERELYSAIAIAEVYLPSHDSQRVGEQIAHEGDQFPLPTIQGPDGTEFISAFSSLTQLARARPEGGGYRQICGRDLARIAPVDLGLALNPGGDLGLPFTPQQLASLVDAPPPDDGASGYLLGEPREEPVELLAAARRMADSRNDVSALYRVLLVRSPSAIPEHLIGVEVVDDADAQAAIDAAFEACRDAGIEWAGFVPIQSGIDSGPVGAFMLDRTQPFWVRAG